MSYSRSLSSILKEKSQTLYSRLLDIEKLASVVLTYTAGGFPFYTPHGINHSKQVEENLNWLIPDAIKPTFDEWEIFFMIIAAWMHDWGMVCKPGERPEEVRKTHHVRTEQNFENMYDKLGLNKHEALIIGRISRGHRIEDVRGPPFEPQIFSNNHHIDVRFLTAIVRIADECDITYNRVPELIYYSLNPQGVNEEHFKNHLSIGGIGKDGEHKIKFYGVAYDPKGSQTLYKLRDKIQKEVDHVKGILAEKKIPIEYVEAQVDARGFIDKPISFKLDERKVTELLIGDALYSRPDVAIRELLQNAVDACRLRKNTDPSSKVEIRIYKEGNQLVIEDNGIGMDYEVASTFLSNKGFSYYTSEEFMKLKENLDFDPISRWGLGILSCFLIANEVKIDTKQSNKNPCKFIILDVGEGWRYENGDRNESGTKITLTLNDVGSTIDLDKTIQYYVKSSSVPIFLGKDSDKPLNFDWTIDDPSIQERIHKMTLRKIPKFSFLTEYEDNEIWARSYESDEIVFESVFLANQGFSVKNFPHLLPFPRNGVILVNIKKNICELDVSRDNVKLNKKFNYFPKKWLDVLKYFIDKEVEKFYDKSYHSVVSKFHILNQYLHKYSIFAILINHLHATNCDLNLLPHYWKDFLLEYKFILILTKDGLALTSLNDIISRKPDKISYYTPSLYMHFSQPMPVDEKHTREILFIESKIKDKLNPNQIVIFLPQTAISPVTKGPLWKKMLLQIIRNDIQSEQITIQDLVREDIEYVSSTLDLLLPKNSRFSKMPSLLSGSVICLSPYTIRYKDARTPQYYGILSHILGIYQTDRFEIIKEGMFVFDINDDFIQILLTKQKEIHQSETLQKMVKNYLLLLLLRSYGNLHFPFDQFIQYKESEIISALNAKQDIKPFLSRQGNMSFFLTSDNPSNQWIKQETDMNEEGIYENDEIWY